MIDSRASKSFAESADGMRVANAPGSAGDSPAVFGDSPKTSGDVREPGSFAQRSHVSRESRDTAGESPALPGRRISPVVWLNLICLDAPVVAVAWLWLFARTFHVAVDAGNAAALFLTAWLIYLADRLADVWSLACDAPRSLRQEFCQKHRRIWVGALVLIAGVDGWLILRCTDAKTFFAGAVVGALALIYLTLNHSLGRIWRSWPLKECAIGFLFAAGTLVALLPAFPSLHGSFLSAGISFASLCVLNCASIAIWERAMDEAQGKVSLATRYLGFAPHLRKISICLALGSLVAAIRYREVAVIFGCVSGSALLLALLDSLGRTVDDDERTALADLVLLTPLIALIATHA